MIQFPCKCGFSFSFQDEMAGSVVQCPKCKLLNDIPTLDDLANMSDDGTYRIGDSQVIPETQRLSELHRLYSREKVDGSGKEIDLRQTMEQLQAAGTEVVPFRDEILTPIPTPKYDPETGELVRPLGMVETEPAPERFNPAEIPMARATLNYATVHQKAHGAPAGLFRPLLELFAPLNLVSMVFVLLLHVIMTIVLPLFLFSWAFMCHYAIVIEEIGPDERDELPRFLRHFSISDDMWRPFANICVAIAYCFALPMLTSVLMPGNALIRAEIVFGLAIFGWFLFPAVILTTTTSGSFQNLTPDRVFNVIRNIGIRYLYLVIVLGVAALAYYIGMAATLLGVLATFTSLSLSWGHVVANLFFWGILAVGIYLMHYFCWLMGNMYRAHHSQFDWVFHGQDRQQPPVLPRGKYALPTAEERRRLPKRVQPIGPVAPAKVLPIGRIIDRGGM